MDLEKVGFEIGRIHGSAAVGIHPEHIDRELSASEVFDEAFRKRAHTEVMNAVHGVLCETGHQDTKEAKLVQAFAAQPRDHSPLVQEGSDLIFDIIKQANWFTTAAKGLALVPGVVQTVAGGLGAAPILGGAAAGALYNLSKRDIQNDSAINEAYRNKIQFYNSLSNEVRSRLKEKYGEEEEEDATR